MNQLKLTLLPERFGICRLAPHEPLPAWAVQGSFFSVTRTAEELSLLCAETAIPAGTISEKGWRCLKVEGPLDFSLIGILSSLTTPLAEVGISVFALSTYDTDYLLVKEDKRHEAIATLEGVGYEVARADVGPIKQEAI